MMSLPQAPLASRRLTLLLCTLLACGAEVQRPNVLLITIDTLRADRLSIYGFVQHVTPAFDRLAREGVVFDAAYTDVSWTTSAMASTLTGLLADRHQLRSNFHGLAPELTTVAEVLRIAGYRTAAVIGSYPLDSIRGLDQGFETYDDSYTKPLAHGIEQPVTPMFGREELVPDKPVHLPLRGLDGRRSDAEVSEAAVGELSRLAGEGQPFFLWVHYFGPHSIANVKQPWMRNRRVHQDTYASRVLETDAALTELLDALDELSLWEDTLVILHADHGESLGEHRYVGHGRFLYENNLRIPMLLRWPARIPDGKRIQRLVANVDVAPTILDAVGVSGLGEDADGRSLLPLIDRGEAVRNELYIETYAPAQKGRGELVRLSDGTRIKASVRRYGILQPPWKLVITEPYSFFRSLDSEVPEEIARQLTRKELFHLGEDPGETRPLPLSDHAEVVAELEAYLEERHRRYGANLNSYDAVPADPGHVERLRAMGYIE